MHTKSVHAYRLPVLMLLLVAACGGEPPVTILQPGDRAFFAGREPLRVEARATGAKRLEAYVDGVLVAELELGSDGTFRGEVPPPPRGRRRLRVTVPGIPGRSTVSELFVRRAPGAPVDGFGFSGDGRWALSLSAGRPSDDGLFEGPLDLFSLDSDGRASRRLTDSGVFGEVSGGIEPWVAWMDGWSSGRGDLHVDAALDGEGRPQGWSGVRGFAFSPSASRMAVMDRGLFVADAPFLHGSERQVSNQADAFFFVGPEEDLVGFAALEDGGDDTLRTFFAASPEYAPIASARTVAPVLASNPFIREAALRASGGDGEEWGGLLLYDFVGRVLSEPLPRVSGFQYSSSGEWLVALSDVDSAGAGELAISRRIPAGAFSVVPGSFVAAVFDGDQDHVVALDGSGVLVEIDLASEPIAATSVAAGVTRFAALRDDAILWGDSAGELFLRRPDGVVVPVGRLHPERPELVFSDDVRRFAFATRDGGRDPLRRVEVSSGAWVDFGEDARRPAFLDDGGFAWAERREDAEEDGGGGLANDDLWLVPGAPATGGGPRRVAERVASSVPFARSPDRTTLAVLADLPRRGERWAANAVCVGHLGGRADLGSADSARRTIFFVPRGEVVWFGQDGPETRVMFVERCEVGSAMSQLP